MSDSFTEVTEEGWLGQIRNSFKSVLLGIILFLAAFPTLFLNEGCYVKRKKALDEGKGAVVHVSAQTVDAANEGKLVHMTGKATTDEILQDEMFDISENAIKLSRVAEMYQWKEEKETETHRKTGGRKVTETHYEYTKTWADSLISSSNFKKNQGHQNPTTKPYKSKSWVAENINLGAFNLSSSLVNRIDAWDTIPVTEEHLNKLPTNLAEKFKVSGGSFYMGDDPTTPTVGDMRISFKVVKPTTVSLYAKQIGKTFEPYTTEAGGTLERLQVGSHSAEEMFAAAQRENILRLWALRIGGFLMMAIGIMIMFSPLVAVANVVPFFGDLIQGGGCLLGGALGFGLSLLTISIAWLSYRPIIGIPLLVVGVGSFVAFVVVKKKAPSQEPSSM